MKLPHRAALAFFAVALVQTAALAQWSSSAATNLAIADFNGDQAVPLIAASGDGTTWMAWFDQRGGSYAVYAQHLDYKGVETFAHGGILVSGHPQNSSLQGWDMISDGAGGCVIAFTDTRNGLDLDVYAYRIDGTGNMLWGVDGVRLSDDADAESNPALALATDGDVICAWAHGPTPGPGAIRIQRIRDNGTLEYPHNGITIPGPALEKPAFASIAASDTGSFIVSYVRDITTFSSPRHIHAQKFDSAGSPQWNAGAPVIVYDQNSIPIAHQPQLRSDGAGGAVLAWHRAVGTAFEVMNQRLDANGVESFAHNGLSVCLDTTIELNPSLSVDPASKDAFLFFNKENTGQSMWSLSVQRVSTTGVRMFGNNAIDLIPIDNVNKLILKSVPYDNGAVCCCFRSSAPVTHDLIGFRVDSSGNSLWGAAPVVASSVVSGKLRVALTTDATGILRMIWGDNRNNVPNGYDMYAQNLNVDGSRGNDYTPSTSFCLGDGTGPACPCANNATTLGRGCASSSYPGGARLLSSGRAGASTGTDTLSLNALDIPGAGLFFQANGLIGASTLGDGQLCAGIGIIRLGVVFPTAGVATYPGGIAPIPIHIAGGPISAGDTKHYQCWYRSQPALCSASDHFDFTQGVTLTWAQ